MNIEQLMDESRMAILQFRRLNNCTCVLKFCGGKVQTLSTRDVPKRYPQSLFISVHDQKNGLALSQWRQIGQTLLTQLNKENSCQKLRKH